MLPVVTFRGGSQPCPRAQRGGMAGLLEEFLCLDPVGKVGTGGEVNGRIECATNNINS